MPANYTKKAIKKSFITLLNKYPLNKISVKSIVDECDISRNTFYYHYQDVPQLLEEIIIDEADALIERYNTVEMIDECINEAFLFAKENRKAIYHIYHSVDREVYEDFLMRMSEHVARTHTEHLAKVRDMSERDKHAMFCFLKYECFGACIDWTRNGMRDDMVDEYHDIINMFFRSCEKFLS